MKKAILLNASPRKNWNTAQLLHAAMDGARSTGAEVTYLDLYDLHFTGCRSCLLCKGKNATRCRCYWNDDLTPVLSEIYAADALLIGTPIYFGRPSSRYFALLERLRFPALSYDDYSNYFTGRVNVGLIVTMNAPQETYETLYRAQFERYARELAFLSGEVRLLPVCNTLQVQDYSRFAMGSFHETDKKKEREENFPAQCKRAFALAAALCGDGAPSATDGGPGPAESEEGGRCAAKP